MHSFDFVFRLGAKQSQALCYTRPGKGCREWKCLGRVIQTRPCGISREEKGIGRVIDTAVQRIPRGKMERPCPRHGRARNPEKEEGEAVWIYTARAKNPERKDGEAV